MSVINAKEATELYNLNAIKYKQEEEQKKQQELLEKASKQAEIDREWSQKAIKVGEKIINYIINDAPRNNCGGLGKKYKSNGYYAKFQSGTTQFQAYRFTELISDMAAKYVENYFKANGYGCEVVKPIKKSEWGYDSVEEGTLYLWIPTAEDEKPEKKKEVSYENGICW